MPWDGTRLLVADIGPGRTHWGSHKWWPGVYRQAQDGRNQCCCRSGLRKANCISSQTATAGGNLHRLRDGSVEPVLEIEAEFARPSWVFGAPSYAFLGDGRIACSYVDRGVWNIGIVDAESGTMTRLDLPFSEMGRGRTPCLREPDRIFSRRPGPPHDPDVSGPVLR